jgi:hypothetical protein
MIPLYLFGIAIGLLYVAAAVFNWEALMFHTYAFRERLMEQLGWENLVRWGYGVGGAGLIGWILFTWLKSP